MLDGFSVRRALDRAALLGLEPTAGGGNVTPVAAKRGFDFKGTRGVRAEGPRESEAGVNGPHAMHPAAHADSRTDMRYVSKTKAIRMIPDAALPQLPPGGLLETRHRDPSSRHVADDSTPGIVSAPDDSTPSDATSAARIVSAADDSTLMGYALPRRTLVTPRPPAGSLAPTAGLEPATRRLTEPQTVTQSEWLRHDESQVGYQDLAIDSRCFTVRQDDSSGNVRRSCAECMGPLPSARSAASPEVPATSEEALRLAVKLAVDAGEYELAAGVLDLLRRTARSAGLDR